MVSSYNATFVRVSRCRLQFVAPIAIVITTVSDIGGRHYGNAYNTVNNHAALEKIEVTHLVRLQSKVGVQTFICPGFLIAIDDDE